ncbi:MAG: hypothetical protein OEL89_03055 [Candidatus Peregrinibacteria bacterium]|nr:hypothetical protein [Candidatus Peregrinibacteria bacterium]
MEAADRNKLYTDERTYEHIHVPKFGSAVLMCDSINNGPMIDHNNIANIGLVMEATKERIFGLTSGAVSFGKTRMNLAELGITDEVIAKSMYAANGNSLLFERWNEAIRTKYILPMLLTHRGAYRIRIEGTEFETEMSGKKYNNHFLNVLENTYKTANIIPFLNNQDLISDRELKKFQGGKEFSDNDELTTSVAKILLRITHALTLEFNTSANGVLDNSGNTIPDLYIDDLDDKTIHALTPDDAKTDAGTGGMRNKLFTIRKFMRNYGKYGKLVSYVLNGKDPSQLESVFNGEKAGTRISQSANLTEI